MKILSIFLVGKYINYAILFVRGLLLASLLNLSQYALWGQVMFVISYYSLFGLGIPNIVLTKYREEKEKDEASSELIGSSLVFISILTILLLVLVSIYNKIISSDHNINSHLLVLLICSNIFLETYRNVARFKERYITILIGEFIVSLVLIIYLICNDTYNINQIILILIVSTFFSVILLFKGVKHRFNARSLTQFRREIWKTGIPLLIYNFSSYALFVLLRYDVLGYNNDLVVSNFNFAWFVSNIIFLSLNIINWYFYPKLLVRASNKSNKYNEDSSTFFRPQFLAGSFIFLIIPLIIPQIISLFFLKYEGSVEYFYYIIAGQYLYYMTYIPSTYIIAKGKHKILIYCAFFPILLFLLLFLYKFYFPLDVIYTFYTFYIASLIFSVSVNLLFGFNKKVYFMTLMLVLISLVLISPFYISIISLTIISVIITKNINNIFNFTKYI